MATRDEALASLRTTAETFAEKYGVDLVLAALREILAPHLTPEAVTQANETADRLEKLKFPDK